MGKRVRQSIIAVLFVFLFLAGNNAHAKKDKPPAPESARPAAAAPAADAGAAKPPKKKGDKPFDEVVDGFRRIEGLFSFYRNDDEGKVYIEIQPDQLDRIYLASVTRSAGDGFYFDSGAMLGEIPFVLKRVGKTIQLLHRNVYFRADETTAIRRALDRGLSDSLVGAGKIVAAPHPERGSLLVDAAGFFVQDLTSVARFFKEFIKAPYGLDKSNSHFGTIRSFPENSEIDVVLHFKSSGPKSFPTLPDARSFRHVYHYSLSSLPDTGYRPRLADDRVGHFVTMFQDYSSVLSDDAYVRYVNRWQLERAEGRFATSPPRQPIVFWLENTIPVEYREAVRQGIVVWNDAFERIGFKEAIVVKQMPDDADWDPADVRYNTVRWIVQPGGGYAVGPSRTDPFTGQIYDADIRVSADMIRSVFLGYEEMAQPVARGDVALAEQRTLLGRDDGLCDYQEGVALQAAFGYSLLEARAGAGAGGLDMERYVHDFIVHVIAHEVGHTLGLRHNFKASTLHRNGELQSAEAARVGLTGSVMDYTPVNLAAPGQPQGAYWQTVLGPYDYWAIEYAYRPVDPAGKESEAAMLQRIAGRAAEPQLAYATDEDTMGGPRGMDPVSNRWDLGGDPIAFYADRVALAGELWSRMEDRFETAGARYPKLRRVFGRGVGQYFIAVMNVTKHIGGIYHHRDHVGDPGARLPLQPVTAAQQREALTFLTRHVFGPEALQVPPSLLNKLAPERFPDFSGRVWRMQRLDYPIHDMVASIQSAPLNHVFHPMLLSRVIDLELRAGSAEAPLTLPELFGEIRGAIWSELEGGDNVNSFRRSLQRAHLDRMIGMLVNPAPGTPEDACTLARADLRALQASIDRALDGSGLDAYTAAHLDESRARIGAALEAGLQRQLGG